MRWMSRLFRKIEVAHANAVIRANARKALADDVALRKRFIGQPYAKKRAAALKATRP